MFWKLCPLSGESENISIMISSKLPSVQTTLITFRLENHTIIPTTRQFKTLGFAIHFFSQAPNSYIEIYIYFQILCSVDPKSIPRLSSCDDEIYQKFRKDYPDLKVEELTEKDLKSEENKKVSWGWQKWVLALNQER